jgi:hypothetical protein
MKIKKSNDTIGATELGKLLGIHPDTVRRRARAGTLGVPFTTVNGKMRFTAPPAAIVKPPLPVEMLTYVQFVVDRSSSMNHLYKDMEKAIEAQLSALSHAPSNLTYKVSVISFGNEVSYPTAWASPQAVKINCAANMGMTALRNAIDVAVSNVERMLITDKTSSHLIIVITDGDDNMSSRISESYLSAHIRAVTASDMLTLVVNCPPSGVNKFRSMGIPEQNVRAWDHTTEGVRDYAVAASAATMDYSVSRAKGLTSSSSYYVNPNDIATNPSKVADILNLKLNDVSSKVKVVRVQRNDKTAAKLNKFCEKHLGGYSPGTIFYELIKTEKVQDYKQIIIQDKVSGKFYHGWDDARKLLKLPVTKGTVNMKPGKLGDFKVFIQSTSHTRKLAPDTAIVLYR